MSSSPQIMGSPRNHPFTRCRARIWLVPTTFPRSCGLAGSCSLAPSSLRSSFARSPAPPLRSELYQPGVLVLFAASLPASTCVGYPAPLRSALRLSQPLDGFLRRQLRGPVSSRNHVQDSLCSTRRTIPRSPDGDHQAGSVPSAPTTASPLGARGPGGGEAESFAPRGGAVPVDNSRGPRASMREEGRSACVEVLAPLDPPAQPIRRQRPWSAGSARSRRQRRRRSGASSGSA